MNSFDLKISAIRRNFYSGPCESLVFSSLDGMVGILPGHLQTIFAVQSGELRFTANGETRILAVGDGTAHVRPDEVVILVDFAELADEIDEVRAQDARENAEALLRTKRDEKSVAAAESALRQAIARLRVAKKKQR